MTNKIIKLITSYTNQLIKHYQAIAQYNAKNSQLRIIAIKKNNENGNIVLKIQLIGKNIFPTLSLNEIQKSDLISNFNERDQHIIKEYIKNTSGKRFSIIARTFNRKIKQFNYTIEYRENKSPIKKYKTIDNLSSLINEIQYFDPDDVSLIRSQINNTTTIL